MVSVPPVAKNPLAAATPTHQLPSLTPHDGEAQTIPVTAFLTLPPFPAKPLDVNLIPFATWKSSGVWVTVKTAEEEDNDDDDDDATGESAKSPSGVPPLSTSYTSYDARGIPLAILDSHAPEDDITTLEAKARAKRSRRLANSKLAVRVEKDDCWKIGKAGVCWDEPEGTSRSNYDSSIPPFTRLISATSDFYLSRLEQFQFTRSKRLFDLMRNALGLRVEFPGPHWSGWGSEGMSYRSQPEENINDGDLAAVPADDVNMEISNPACVPNGAVDEVCVLLRKMETSVRGFLALARREAEAGWDFEPALLLAKITAAYLAFIRHYAVLIEPDLLISVERVALLARYAPQQILDAKQVEDILCHRSGWNRAAWSVWGGSYGAPERGGLEKEAVPVRGIKDVKNDEEDQEDGGWTVDTVIDTRPEALTASEARPFLAVLTHPLLVDEISLLEYVPYARRSISSVLPPLAPSPGLPQYASKLHRLVTVPAPWSTEEKWRVPRPRFNDEGSEDDGEDETGDGGNGVGPLEKEEATLEEPKELVILFEGDSLGADFDMGRLIGMGLRGRWALMGQKSRGSVQPAVWWVFKAKDFILPRFWQSPTTGAGSQV